MRELDETIQRAYLRMKAAEQQLRPLQRYLHPETMKWKDGLPSAFALPTQRKIQEMARIGLDEAHYQRMLAFRDEALEELTQCAELHPLWSHFELIKGLGLYLCGCYVAATGDIGEAPTVSAHWKRMGLDLVDGKPPRKTRGSKAERRLPALPFVTEIGEQLRQQFARSGGMLQEEYVSARDRVDAANVGRAKIFNYKGAQRIVQKRLYSCLWREHRLAYGLPAPEAYAFDILKHGSEPLRINHFYDQ